MLEDILSKLNFIISIKSFNLRTAVSCYLDKGTSGVIASNIYEYLLYSYYEYLCTKKFVAERHEYFMLKTVVDIQVATQIGLGAIKSALKLLEEKNLIEFGRRGLNNTTSLKINENMAEKIEECLEEYLHTRDEYLSEKEALLKNQKESLKKNLNHNIDFDKLNEISEENNSKDLVDFLGDYETFSLIYVVNHYYKKYTKRTYKWNLVKFNTLMSTWKGHAYSTGSEQGMSWAIKKELDNKTEQREPFEVRVRGSFDHDFHLHPNKGVKVEGVVFDNILRF